MNSLKSFVKIFLALIILVSIAFFAYNFTHKTDVKAHDVNNTVVQGTIKKFLLKDGDIFAQMDDGREVLFLHSNKSFQHMLVNKDNSYIVFSVMRNNVYDHSGQIIGFEEDWYLYNVAEKTKIKLNNDLYVHDAQKGDIVVYKAVDWIDNDNLLLRDGDYFTTDTYLKYNVKTKALTTMTQDEVLKLDVNN